MSRHRFIRASAGTDKTHALVETYAEQIARGQHPSEVVALTFTKKAAGELLQRIRGRLEQSGASLETLRELEQSPISNFHGFALQILKGWGISDAIPQNFQILGDQGDDAALFVRACEEAWLGGDQDVHAALQACARYFSFEQLPSQLWEAIGRAREDGVRPNESLLDVEYRPDETQKRIHEQLLSIRQAIANARPTLSAKAAQRADEFLRCAVPSLEAPLEVWEEAWRTMGQFVDRRTKLRQVVSAEDKQRFEQDVGLPRAEMLCAKLSPHVARLVCAGWETYQQLKARYGVMDFGDLVEHAVDLLSKDANAQQAVCRRVKTVLVDEAQDTNRLQRKFLRLVAGLEGPAAGRVSIADLVVVGDEKQAIYTFRGADPQAFDVLRQDVDELGGEHHTLEVTWRSNASLVTSVNALSEQIFTDHYDPLAPNDMQTDKRRPLKGCGFGWLECGKEEEARQVAEYVARSIEQGVPAGDFAILLSAMTRAHRYADALAARQVPVVLGGGGGLYEQSEIVALISLIAWLYDPSDRLAAATALRSPLLGLSDNALVRLLLRVPQGEDHLWELYKGHPLNQLEDAHDREVLQRVAHWVHRLRGIKLHLSAIELLQIIDAQFDVRASVLALPGGEQRLANVDRLFEVAHHFDQREEGGVSRFVGQVMRRVRYGHAEALGPMAAESTRAVRIMSVHQSKGLEFGHVILADLSSRSSPDAHRVAYQRDVGFLIRPQHAGKNLSSAAWQQMAQQSREESDAEKARLLYVAMTRAQRRVLFVGDSKASKEGFWRFVGPWIQEGLGRGHVAPRTMETDTAGQASPVLQRKSVPALGEAPPSPMMLPVTHLESLLSCNRRGLWRHHFGLEEPRAGAAGSVNTDQELDARTRGELAHAVLAGLDQFRASLGESAFVQDQLFRLGYAISDPRIRDVRETVVSFLESPMGQRIVALPPNKRRFEMPFQWRVHPQLALLGQIDLVYEEDGQLVILDYKLAQGHSVEPYRWQLVAYATALAAGCDLTTDVRCELVYLRNQNCVTMSVDASMRDDFVKRCAKLVGMLQETREDPQAVGAIPYEECKALGCGFIGVCHQKPQRAATTSSSKEQVLRV